MNVTFVRIVAVLLMIGGLGIIGYTLYSYFQGNTRIGPLGGAGVMVFLSSIIILINFAQSDDTKVKKKEIEKV